MISSFISLVGHSFIFVRSSVESSSVLTSFSSKKSSVKVSFREIKKKKKILKPIKKKSISKENTKKSVPLKNLEVEQASVEAKVLNKIIPKYPRKSRVFREEGVVLLKVIVGNDGRAIRSELLSSSGYDRLDEAAREAALASEYERVTNNDSINSHIELEFKFELTE